ncbi:MAG TPA: helix-turn-helix transcriptional regulator [Thermomicrobiales bacterium]|nr:helix-turn-helix transcriptional regulator [Thermomicrobiales bacterium]
MRALRDVRQRAGLTMEELADRAGVHRTYIGLLEQGKRQPTVDAAARIAEALGLRLSDLLRQAEDQLPEPSPAGPPPGVAVLPGPARRTISREHFLPAGSAALQTLTGLDREVIARAVESAYLTLDLIDEQLLGKNAPPIAQLVELANLSSMLGNLLGAGIAEGSQGLFVRNRPHAFPDLLARRPGLPDIELKVALERNSPKGHLAKPGAYITFRYVLVDHEGSYTRGRAGRGSVATVWEVRCGQLAEGDFALSNTAGDSGKTAVIKRGAFTAMPLVYYVQELNPSARATSARAVAQGDQQ